MINGIAKAIILRISGGVIMADTANMATMAMRHFSISIADRTILIVASKVNNTGSSKLIPKAKMSLITNDRYSLTFASNWMGSDPSRPVDSKLKKKL